jgi:hypothetical protein
VFLHATKRAGTTWVSGLNSKEVRITLTSQLRFSYGAEDRSRTYTPVKEADFEF